ncbi:MAG: NAD-dependent epimerase/dehydratase family protein [Deltaproteobacteria bacterium]|nr:NAD-dependent epimerase/dehydratase family protein [Deltaproteobacteria bacterium]
MGRRVLITGGAGFIGSHLTEELIAHGYRVRVLDNLSPRVHGAPRERSIHLPKQAELCVGDVRSEVDVRRALTEVDSVVHLAAMVGAPRSMYEVAATTSVNSLGTAVLMEALLAHPVERLVVASSTSVYGEGEYIDQDGEVVVGALERSPERLRDGNWELRDALGRPLHAIPTREPLAGTPTTVYALSSYDRERMCLVLGLAYEIPTVVLRIANAYGPRLRLGDPDAGVIAAMASRLFAGAPPLLYEDGLQLRDFVDVRDVARAFRLALEVKVAAGQVFNVGSGEQWTIRDVARRLAVALGMPLVEPRAPGRYRPGDVRHSFPDIGRALGVLGYRPSVRLPAGLRSLAAWIEERRSADHGPAVGSSVRGAAS